jgi:hypothetical protein
MAVVVRNAVYAGVVHPHEDLVVPTATRRWRIPRHELVELVDREWRSGAPYGVVRGRLPSLVAEIVRRRMEAGGGAPDDRVVNRLARAEPIRGWVDAHWPAVTAPALVARLLSEPGFLGRCAAGVLSDGEQRRLLWPEPPAHLRAVRWSVADAFLVDEAAGMLDRPRSYGHVVADEAQDLSALQCRALARRCPTGSATILGDLAQATAPGAVADWRRTVHLLGRDEAQQVVLTTGFRVPAEVLDFANRLLPSLGVDVAPAASLRHAADALRLRRTDRVPSQVAATVRDLLDLDGSIGVIALDDDLRALRAALRTAGVTVDTVEHGMEARVTLTPVTLCKGLEFDHVVVAEPAAIADALDRGLNWLYVALTRAVTTLTVVHARELPPPLSQEPAAA